MKSEYSSTQQPIAGYMHGLSPNSLFADRYRLRKRLGEDGLSETWLAFDEQAGNEQVAKIFVAMDEQGIKSFRREFSKAGHLKHAHLLPVSRFDIYQGHPYLVLPYCQQESILKLAGRLNEREIAKIISNVGGVLAFLHQPVFHIVHRHVMPANICMSEEGDYLLNIFGISAKLQEEFCRNIAEKGLPAPNDAGMPPPPFRAPECFAQDGKNNMVAASDIWALGATLYTLATGQPPFGQNGGGRQLSGMAPPDLPPLFSRPLSNILKHCLAKEPWIRPSAEGLKLMAEEYLESGEWPGRYSEPNGEGWRAKRRLNLPEIKFGRTELGLLAVLLAIVGIVAMIKVGNDNKPVAGMDTPAPDSSLFLPDIQQKLLAEKNKIDGEEVGNEVVNGPVQQIAEEPEDIIEPAESLHPAPQEEAPKTENRKPAPRQENKPLAENKGAGPAAGPEKLQEKGAPGKPPKTPEPETDGNELKLWPWYNEFNKKWGYIDKAGGWAVWPQFEEAGPFQGGKAKVAKKNSNGELGYYYLDRNGILVPIPETEPAGSKDN